MKKPGKSHFNYDYPKFQAVIDDLTPVIREVATFIARNDDLDSFMGDLAFNRGDKDAAKALYERVKAAGAPDYLLAMVTIADLQYLTEIYNHPISLLLQDD